MKVKSGVDRNRGRFLVALAAAALLLVPNGSHAADTGGGAASKSTEVTFEAIPGSTVKRVILTKKAAERLDIQTGKVAEDVVVAKLIVSGLVVSPFSGAEPPKQSAAAKSGAAGAAPSGEVWLQVTLTPGEWERMVKDKPARVVALPTREKLAKEVTATLSKKPPVEDPRRTMLTVYYVVGGRDTGLTLNNRMRVELPLAGSEEKQKVVPYSAVYYDAKGAAWAYVTTKPLAYERQKLVVSRIVGDVAVLTEGPPVGTAVVIAGAPLLMGTEIYGK